MADAVNGPSYRSLLNGVWRDHLAVLLGYALLTVVMTWPLVAHLDSAVLGPPGDNLEYVWKVWWFKEALLERGVSPLYVPDVFYPYGYPLALSETTMTHTVLGLPLTALWGEVVSYNVMVYLSFVVSGYGLYLLARDWGCSRAAAFVGGLAFAFCPYRFSHVGAGHLPLLGTGWIPLSFLGLERLVRGPSLLWAALTGLFYALLALSSWYYALMGLPFGVLYLVLRARPWSKRLWRWRLWSNLLLAGLLFGVLVAPAALPILRLYDRGETHYSYGLAYVDQWSASPVDFLYPNAMHSWWGTLLTKGYYQNINENLLYVGCVTLVLAAMGLWWRRRERVPRVLALLGGIAFVLALGTTLHFAGEPVYLRVPPVVERWFSRGMYVLTGKLALNKVKYGALRRQGAIVLPMPTLLLYLFVPFAKAMRVWARFGLWVIFSVSALAAWGLDGLLDRLRLRKRSAAWSSLAVTLIALLILLDFAVIPYPYGYTEARGQPVDRWLARRADRAPVAQFPLGRTWYGGALYAARVHGHPIAYGYGTFVPQAYQEASCVLESWPSQQALDLLRRWGVRYVLVAEESHGETWPAVRRAVAYAPGLEERGVFPDERRFRGDRLLRLVPPTADVPSTQLVNGPFQAHLRDRVHVYEIK
jgi:hypothetical protein